MILYSIIPSEIVFNKSAGLEDSTPEMLEMEYLGERVIARLLNNNYVIERIIGTSLKSFLDVRFQPGTLIKENVSGREQ